MGWEDAQNVVFEEKEIIRCIFEFEKDASGLL